MNIFPGEYQAQVDALRSQCRQLTTGLQAAKAAITTFQFPPREFAMRHYPAQETTSWEADAHLAECSQLLNDVDGCLTRIGGPLSIAVLGAFNSGKSSTINELCALIIGTSSENLPAHIKRPTDINPCTQEICVIQHPSSPRPAVNGEGLEYVTIDHDAFRHINLIDTPGSQDRPELDEISRQYLAYADVFLFINTANRLITHDDRQFYEYIERNYPRTQIVFVITYANTLFLDGTTLNEQEVRRALDNANSRIARDISPGARFRLTYGTNVFFVERKNGYGYRELYDHIISGFSSEEAGREKLSRLKRQLSDLSKRVKCFLDALITVARACQINLETYLDKAINSQLQVVLEEKIPQWLTANELKLRSAIDMAIDPSGYATIERKDSQLDKIRRTRPSTDALLPATFPTIEIQKISAELTGLRRDLDAVQRLEELFLSQATFQAEVETRASDWLNKERVLLLERLNNPDGPSLAMEPRLASQLMVSAFTSNQATNLRKQLRKRIESLIQLYTILPKNTAISALSAIRITLTNGYNQIRQYSVALKQVADNWCLARDEETVRLLATFKPLVQTCTDGLIDSIALYFDNIIAPPIRRLSLSFTIDLASCQSLLSTVTSWKQQIPAQVHLRISTNESQLRASVRAAAQSFQNVAQEQTASLTDHGKILFDRLEEFLETSSLSLRKAATESLQLDKIGTHNRQFEQKYQQLSDKLDQVVIANHTETMNAIRAMNEAIAAPTVRSIRAPAIISSAITLLAICFIWFAIPDLSSRGVGILTVVGISINVVYCASLLRQNKKTYKKTAYRDRQHQIESTLGHIAHHLKVFQRDVMTEITSHNNAEQKAILGAFSIAWDKLNDICNDLTENITIIRQEFGRLYAAHIEAIETVTASSLEAQKFDLLKFLKDYPSFWQRYLETETKQRVHEMFKTLRKHFADATACNRIASQELSRISAEIKSAVDHQGSSPNHS